MEGSNQRSNPIKTVLAILLVLGMGWLLTSCQMPELTHVSSDLGTFPTPQDCAHCHVEIYKEWASSPHASAFVSNTYRRATDDYRFKECIGCHAPQPMLTAAQPLQRATQQQLGVVCVSCHLDEGAMVGPHAPTGIVKPHPIRVEPAVFENGTLCGRCHQSTLNQWQAATISAKQDCRTCHMPEVQRTMTQATSLISKPLVAAETPGIEHRHSFCLITDELPAKAYDLQATAAAGVATVALTNLLPHNLPTGDFGVRIIRVVVMATDASGKQSPLADWEINGNLGASIPAGGSRSWTVALPGGTHKLNLQLIHQGRDAQDQIVLMRKDVALP